MKCGLVGDGELVCSGGQATPLLEVIDAPLDGVALFVGLAVEAWRAATSAASPQAVADLVARLRDDCADSPASQVAADGAGRVGAVGQHGHRPGPWPARSASRHTDAGHHRLESGCVTGLACSDGEGQRPGTAVRGQVDLGTQAAAGASKGVIGGLIDAGRPLLRAPEACWWARTTVESTDTVQSMSSSASAAVRTAERITPRFRPRPT